MTANRTSKLPDILASNEKEILADWLKEQLAATTMRRDLINEDDLRRESGEFLALFARAVAAGTLENINDLEWAPCLEFLTGLSRRRAIQGFSPRETATFIFSLKKPLLSYLQTSAGKDTAYLLEEFWTFSVLLDKLGLFTAEAFQTGREEVIKRQQVELLELSTPVVRLWDGILALPLIGTLDSSRTQIVMEGLLNAIVETGSEVAIIDITGVPAVDTLVAQHLLKTVAAARLMGAQCIISGIRPQIAQTMVHLGVAFGDVVTKSSMSDALSYSFKQLGISVSRRST